MTTDSFEVMSAVYKLLAQFSHDQFDAASRNPHISPNLKSALKSLAVEANSVSLDARNDSTSLNREGSKSSHRSRPHRARTPELRTRDQPTNVTDLLTSPESFPDKDSLMKFAKNAGLSIKPDPKASRERLARRIAKEARQTKAGKAKLQRALADSVDNETRGWLNLIVGESR